MLSNLKFVQGAVSKKEFLPGLTHFRIEAGQVRSFNGTLALCSPIEFDMDCTPRAEPFIRAIMNCEDTVQMSMSPSGRLSIRSGPFKAHIECIEEVTPHVFPEGELFNIEGEHLLDAMKKLNPFIGNDASRPWSNGVLLKGQSAFATNNIIAVEYWVGSQFPFVCNIPQMAVKEIIRINEAPIQAQADEKSITFHYESGRWIRTQLYDINWPEIPRLLDLPSNPVQMDDRLFTALDNVKPFSDKMGRVYIKDGTVSTTLESEDGASYTIPDLDFHGVYQIEMLNKLKGVVTRIDHSKFPAPALFFGERLRGAIIGMRA